MPRSQSSAEGKILQFFRSADLLVVGLILSLAREIVQERVNKAAAAKAAGLKGAAIAKRKAKKRVGKALVAVASTAGPKAPAKKKSHKKKAASAQDAELDNFLGQA